MKKTIRILLLAFVALLLVSGCSTTYTANTKSVKTLRSDLKNVSSSINKVEVSFLRPNLYIKVYFTDEPTKETIDTVFEKVKSFTTDDTIKEIGPTVHWSSIDMGIGLFIYADNSKESASYTYSTSYYKTYDHTNNSPDNINDFKVWSEGPPW